MFAATVLPNAERRCGWRGLLGVVAFSPGFVTNAEQQSAKPRLFISHGLRDGVLAIETTSRVIVPELRADCYDVTYVKFDGTHTIPASIASAAIQFILAR